MPDDDDGDSRQRAGDARGNADNKVTFAYEMEVSAADFYAAVQDSGKGTYTGGENHRLNRDRHRRVTSKTDTDLTTPGGVGLVSQPDVPLTIEK